MADIKSKETFTRANLDKPSDEELRTANQSPEELEKASRHEPLNQERRDVTDADVGEDRILRKGIGGYGADDKSVVARKGPPLTDKSRE